MNSAVSSAGEVDPKRTYRFARPSPPSTRRVPLRTPANLPCARANVPSRNSMFLGPLNGLVGVAQAAGVGAFSASRVAAGEINRNVWACTLTSGDRLLVRRHVARHALVAGAVGLVMRVRLDGEARGPVWAFGAVTCKHMSLPLARSMRRVSAVRIVAGKAGHAARVHPALDEVVALHPVLVSGCVGQVREGGLARDDALRGPRVALNRSPG